MTDEEGGQGRDLLAEVSGQEGLKVKREVEGISVNGCPGHLWLVYPVIAKPQWPLYYWCCMSAVDQLWFCTVPSSTQEQGPGLVAEERETWWTFQALSLCLQMTHVTSAHVPLACADHMTTPEFTGARTCHPSVGIGTTNHMAEPEVIGMGGGTPSFPRDGQWIMYHDGCHERQ